MVGKRHYMIANPCAAKLQNDIKALSSIKRQMKEVGITITPPPPLWLSWTWGARTGPAQHPAPE